MKERELRLKGASRSRSGNKSQGVPALRDLATKYLGPVERKLTGLVGSKGVDKALGIPGYVELMIKEARDPANFVSLICAMLNLSR